MNDKTIITSSGNRYLYSGKDKYFIYLPNNVKGFPCYDNKEQFDEYHARKLDFLKSNGLLEEVPTQFQVDCSSGQIIRNIANLSQLLIEVTEGCNLKCKYCGYGDLYNNHGKRHGKSQNLEGVKKLIDYICKLKKTENNLLSDESFSIGFYGGEPLLNFPFIKEVVNHVKSISNDSLSFSFNMTTNAMFLDKYMDFLVDHDFNLLISLDGDEKGDSYRVDKFGNPSFDVVVKNVKSLKEKYQDYFERKVNFNSVLHDRNSVLDSSLFIFREFGKVPRIAELNTSGIANERQEEFSGMFKNRMDSLAEAQSNPSFVKEIGRDEEETKAVHTFLMNHTGNHFLKYSDMFVDPNTVKYVPTSTCKPFEKKMYVTVEGKLFVCERIGQLYPLAYLKNGDVEIDASAIADFYKKLYQSIVNSCRDCAASKFCNQCLYFLDLSKDKLHCPGKWSIKHRNQFFAWALSYLESYPDSYHRLLSSIKVS